MLSGFAAPLRNFLLLLHRLVFIQVGLGKFLCKPLLGVMLGAIASGCHARVPLPGCHAMGAIAGVPLLGAIVGAMVGCHCSVPLPDASYQL